MSKVNNVKGWKSQKLIKNAHKNKISILNNNKLNSLTAKQDDEHEMHFSRSTSFLINYYYETYVRSHLMPIK